MDVIVPGKNDTLSPYDIQKLLDERPDAPAVRTGRGFHHWGEPTWAITSPTTSGSSANTQMLSDAGVDVIIIDMTNEVIYLPIVTKLMEVYRKMRSEGNRRRRSRAYSTRCCPTAKRR